MNNKIFLFTFFILFLFITPFECFAQLTTRLELIKRTRPYTKVKFKPMQKINFYTKDSKIIGVLTHKQDGNLFVQPSNPNIQFPTENSIIKIPIQNINAVRIFETEKETKIKAGNRTLGNIILIPSILVFAFSISASSSPEINLPWTNYVLSSIGIGVGLVIINNNKSKNYPTRYWRIY